MRIGVAVVGEVEENPIHLSFDRLQEQLAQTLAQINETLKAATVVPTQASEEGSDFIAELTDLASAHALARHLAEAFHPLRVRVGATQGRIEGRAKGGNADPQGRGPAFERAAELLGQARKEDRWLILEGGGDAVDLLANALFLVLDRDRQGWTERQAEVVRLYRVMGRQASVAGALGISQQAVSNSLTAAGWTTLYRAEAAIQRVLAAAPARSRP